MTHDRDMCAGDVIMSRSNSSSLPRAQSLGRHATSFMTPTGPTTVTHNAIWSRLPIADRSRTRKSAIVDVTPPRQRIVVGARRRKSITIPETRRRDAIRHIATQVLLAERCGSMKIGIDILAHNIQLCHIRAMDTYHIVWS